MVAYHITPFMLICICMCNVMDIWTFHCMDILTYSCLCMYVHMDIMMYVRTHVRMCTYIHMDILMYGRTHILTCTYIHMLLYSGDVVCKCVYMYDCTLYYKYISTLNLIHTSTTYNAHPLHLVPNSCTLRMSNSTDNKYVPLTRSTDLVYLSMNLFKWPTSVQSVVCALCQNCD